MGVRWKMREGERGDRWGRLRATAELTALGVGQPVLSVCIEAELTAIYMDRLTILCVRSR